ncbi:MAG: hypothetical protein A3K19_29430 [Lentisphaerae bacterium RIFOXYB12_FULL_65_16]|nr:MAG: hypothetical protein A3K18_22990 [Lentisphaerae bacterium RIFOXYA12_64_32]OGV88418.1 MAG: hypothetical protein A3K19_29430 [Lentisphaerae bacterium RIFOXYB12_FULL_65_16]
MVKTTRDEAETASRELACISDREFGDIVSPRLQPLLRVSRLFEPEQLPPIARPLLASLLAESTRVEELLDSYGARNSSQWFMLRRMVAAIKNFSHAGYELLHLHHSEPRYRLLPVGGDLVQDTAAAIDRIGGVLQGVARHLNAEAQRLDLTLPDASIADSAALTESLPRGALARDRKTCHETPATDRVVRLATSFLELAAESRFLAAASRVAPADYASLIPETVSEESLRQIEYKFHSLQSLYDTYISDSDTEETDVDLRALRGHISVVFHLMAAATLLAHFYERHMVLRTTNGVGKGASPVDDKVVLALLIEYCVGYTCRYLDSARGLCHSMLRRYATVSELEVPVPRYRGFHVRPSTLVAKIVHHYGSDVTMRLGDQTYDAGNTLDLFRANEQINAEKRRQLAEEIGRMPLDGAATTMEELVPLVRRTVLDLAALGRIVIYTQPLPLEELRPRPDESAGEVVAHEICQLLMRGKIDIEADMKVTFVGDERVLKDLGILAEHGYCEDRFGNNTPLPPELGYLRRN